MCSTIAFSCMNKTKLTYGRENFHFKHIWFFTKHVPYSCYTISNMSNINRNFVYSYAKIIIVLQVSKYKSIHVL